MIIKNKKHCRKKHQRGAILLIAVTVASLVLAIGLGILNITTKEIILSAYSRESGKAFYAANTGIECALFWDINYASSTLALPLSPFATSSDLSLSETNDLKCAGQIFNVVPHIDADFDKWDIERDATSATTTFKFSTWTSDSVSYGEPVSIDNPCVEVILSKYKDGVTIKTKISSFGYNTCDESKKRRVSRGVRVSY